MNHYIIRNPVMSQAATGRAQRAGKLIIFDFPARTADGAWHGVLSPRPAAFFKREIDKAPADAVLLIDLHATERLAFEDALSRSKRARAGIVEALHADFLRLKANFARVALLPVGSQPPKTREETATTCYTIAEIVEVFLATQHDRFFIRNALPAGSSKLGGGNRAHYKDKEILTAFLEYRRERPKGSLWGACRWLTRKGNPLEDYKKDGQRCLLRHVKKIVATGNFGAYIDAEAWFCALPTDSIKI